jgi:hypothetical protein
VKPPSILYRTTRRVPGSAPERNCCGEGGVKVTCSY